MTADCGVLMLTPREFSDGGTHIVNLNSVRDANYNFTHWITYSSPYRRAGGKIVKLVKITIIHSDRMIVSTWNRKEQIAYRSVSPGGEIEDA